MYKISSIALFSLFTFQASAQISGVLDDKSGATSEYTQLNTSELTQLGGLPSASASVFYNDKLYVVGDDSPALYVLDKSFSIRQQTDIQNAKPEKNGRIKWDKKADLEGAELFFINHEPTLVMVGSGTHNDTREKALLHGLKDGSISWKNIRPLYRSLRKFANLKKDQFINIEGLASNHDKVFMLSRGSHGPNLVFTFDKNDFLNYITGEVEQITKVIVQKVALTRIEGVEATLSGATWHEASQRLVITTSVDDDDKGILGSFVSYIHAAELPKNAQAKAADIDLTQRAFRIYNNNQPLTSKVESVVVTHTEGEKISGVLTADNDDGTSQFMRFSLTL